MVSFEIIADEAKDYKICNVLGGLDLTRLVSTNARNFFSSAIDDVELMREYLGETTLAGNWMSDFASLEEMGRTVDWQARGLPEGTASTVDAGLGYTDDRPDRRVDRYMGLLHQPPVGDPYTDFTMMDALSPLLPWIVDSKSKESAWWIDHHNGVSQGEDYQKETFQFDSLYTAAWLVSTAETVIYYPPLSVYGHPLTLGDVVGEYYNSTGDAFVVPNLPQNNPNRRATFTAPYPDVALEGVALITATAPVYFDGNFRGYHYNDIFVASLGVDIKVDSVSAFLDVLQDSLTPSSFGLLVDSSFNAIVISQEVVKRIYPERTGLEESRVTYDLVDGSIVQDRRNQTYLPSDTILQDLTKLDNADWIGLLETVQQVTPGDSSHTTLNVTLTGDTAPTEFHVMFDTWEYVADWTLLVFAPKVEVENAIDVYTVAAADIDGDNKEHSATSGIEMEGHPGSVLLGRSTIVNGGSLGVQVSLASIPPWVTLVSDLFDKDSPSVLLRPQEELPIDFEVSTAALATGTQSDSVVFDVQDQNDYPDCFFSEPLGFRITVKVLALDSDCPDNFSSDANGSCVCSSGWVHVNGGCMKKGALAASIVVPILVLAFAVVCFYRMHKRRLAESFLEIDESELEFSDPPVSIGEGSFGRVYLAEYHGTRVAVKTITFSNSVKQNPQEKVTPDETMEKGFSSIETDIMVTAGIKTKRKRQANMKEIRLLSKLQHRNVLCVMGAVVRGTGDPMLVLEYMECHSVFDLLNGDKQVDGELILSILQDATQGIRFLHNAKPHQVILGDIKAQNILLDSKYRAKVADFGTGISSPQWMAPELIRKETPINTATDVYAFGITLHQVYAKTNPYEDEDIKVVLQEVSDPKVKKRPPFPATMKTCVAALMHDCVLANAVERPTMNELVSRINRFSAKDLDFKEPETKTANNDNSLPLGMLQKFFPPDIAQALSEGNAQESEKVTAYGSVSLVYLEIVGLGALTSKMAPIKVADLLHRLFERIETLAEKYSVFSVDMSGGGAWMGATNCVQDQSKDHAKRIAEFAKEVMQVSSGTTLIDEGHPERGYAQVQMAIHSGPVHGKVLGKRMPRYSLFGPTVDAVAFLATQKSEMGGILCSEQTQTLLEVQAPTASTVIVHRVAVPDLGATTVFWLQEPKEETESCAYEY